MLAAIGMHNFTMSHTVLNATPGSAQLLLTDEGCVSIA
jgi:hypothetical protein